MKIVSLVHYLGRESIAPENLYLAGSLSTFMGVLTLLVGLYWWMSYQELTGVGLDGVTTLFYYLVPLLFGIGVVSFAGGIISESWAWLRETLQWKD